MAYRKVIQIGDDVLRKACRPVEKVNHRILQLLDDLVDTMHAENGSGLAAPQVGVLRRVAVVEDGDVQYDLINPKLIHMEGRVEDVEGCLSISGRRGIVPRPAKVKVQTLNRKGEVVILEAEGYTARALCHEMDHLDGILYIDKQLREATEEELCAAAEASSEK